MGRTVTTLFTLTTVALFAASLSGTARADVSSLDAYAGEAAVLGKPHHHRHPGSRATSGQSHATGSTSSSTSAGNGTSAGRATGAGGAGGRAGSASGTSRSSTSSGSTAAATPGRIRSRALADPAGAGSGLTGTDIAALAGLVILLLAGAVLIRRASRDSSSPSGPTVG